MTIALNSRYATLDAMRGVAAVMVLAGHLAVAEPALAVNADLAVDFFFVLSGFVIAMAYGEKLARGMGFADFLRERLIRLYPLFAMGLGFAVAKELGEFAFGQGLAPLVLLRAIASEALMLPAHVAGRPEFFPLNGPAWSLGFEMLVNIAFAAFALHLTTRRLAVTILLAGMGVVAASLAAGHVDGGWAWDNWPVGLARVGFSFPLGVLIYRLGVVQTRRVSLWFLAPAVLLTWAITVHVAPAFRPGFDAGFVILLSPMLLIAGASFEPPRVLQKVCAKLGEISYSLYATHFPLMLIGEFVARKLGIPTWAYVGALLVGLPVLAWVFSEAYDKRVRVWLNGQSIRSPRKISGAEPVA